MSQRPQVEEILPNAQARAAAARGIDEQCCERREMFRARLDRIDPLQRDPEGFRWRTRAQIDEGRSWVWAENGTILFKAEASAWTPHAVQLQQVWVDPAARKRGNGKRGLRDLCRVLLARVPTVCLFVRRDNAAAIRLYEAIGMRHTISYRSLIF